MDQSIENLKKTTNCDKCGQVKWGGKHEPLFVPLIEGEIDYLVYATCSLCGVRCNLAALKGQGTHTWSKMVNNQALVCSHCSHEIKISFE